MSAVLTLEPSALTVEAPSGKLLSDILKDAGIPISLYCGGRGLCGKCLVEIKTGPLPPPNAEEKEILDPNDISSKLRLACRYRVAGDLTIRLPEASLIPSMPVLIQGIRRTLALDPAVKKIPVSLPRPDLALPRSLLDLLADKFPKMDVSPGLAGLRRLPALQEGRGRVFTAVVYDDREILAFEPGHASDRAYGIAVDLGTTTVVVELIDLSTGTSIGTSAGLNGQFKYGADVVSRISAAYLDPNKLEELRAAVLESLNGLIRGLLARNGIAEECVVEAVVAGNTAMNHLFLGLPVGTLALSPYYAVFSVLAAIPSSDTGLAMNSSGRVYVSPNIKSFVGGDISAGLVAVDLESRPGNFLFIDLGTNGEIVLKKGRAFTATSTAAGPAFEGMSIGCGMLALPGAVYKAELTDRFRLRTIGDEPARGICGTGLIDVVAASLRNGRMSPSGRIQDPSKKISVTRDLALSQKDVREIQLACAAVKTGIRTLLKNNRLTTADLDGVYVAGAFGNYLNIRNATAIGLLPRVERKKIFFIGNSSLAGAKALLVSRAERRRCERLVGRVRHLSLARDPDFQNTYVAALEFKAWS